MEAQRCHGFKDLSGRRWIQAYLYFPQKVGIRASLGFRLVHVMVDLEFPFCWSHCLDRSRHHFAVVTRRCKVTRSEGDDG